MREWGRVHNESPSFEATTMTAPGIRRSLAAISMMGSVPAMPLRLAMDPVLRG
jgi:hypothetical protein